MGLHEVHLGRGAHGLDRGATIDGADQVPTKALGHCVDVVDVRCCDAVQPVEDDAQKRVADRGKDDTQTITGEPPEFAEEVSALRTEIQNRPGDLFALLSFCARAYSSSRTWAGGLKPSARLMRNCSAACRRA